MSHRVLSASYQKSDNFYRSDLILQHIIETKLPHQQQNAISDRLEFIGQKAALKMDELSLVADQNPPELIKRDRWGEKLDQISFHPSYQELVQIAVESGMFSIKWKPENRKLHHGHTQKMSFAISSIYAMSEMGVYCPLCMTDGAALLIDQFCDSHDRKRLLSAITENQEKTVKTGAMYLTEKTGGSDVGANEVKAQHFQSQKYYLNGEKWFCSNANGSIAFVLARTDPSVKGTKGLSLFLVEKELEDGSPNPMEIVRLKDKLGVRSMASAEIMLNDTVGKLVGEEFKGFKMMAQMINLSRLYNSVAAISASRRAMTEAYQFLNGRHTFGEHALEHALIRKKLNELSAIQVSNTYLTWRAIEAMDNAENDKNEAELLRILTPMTKKCTAEKGVYITRESMELMGGIGYIEDQVMPKIMRDIMVLPIWEGSGNIMTLDMLRASHSSKGLALIMKEISDFKNGDYASLIKSKLDFLEKRWDKIKSYEKEHAEYYADDFFSLLTQVYQLTLLIKNKDEKSQYWIDPAIHYLARTIQNDQQEPVSPPSSEAIKRMMGWKFD